jgi:hypothetical protein
MKTAIAVLTILLATPAVAGSNAAFNDFDPLPPEAVKSIEAQQRLVTQCMFKHTNKPYTTVEDVARIVDAAAQGPCLDAIKKVEAQLGVSRSEQWWMDFEMLIKAAHYAADDGGIVVGP